MKRWVTITVLLTVAAVVFAADGVIGPAEWRSWRGRGDGVTTDTGIELIDDAKDVVKVWTSEIQDIPFTWPKHGGNGFSGYKICGGYGSPVVVSGRVFIAWWEPSGEKVDANAVAKAKDKRPDKWKPTADEILACIDARTGKTLWKTRMAGTGYNHQYQNHCSIYMPVSAEGVVCLQGNAGWVYCFEVGDGSLRWKQPIGAIADVFESWRQAGLIDVGQKNAKHEGVRLKSFDKYGNNVSPVIVDGVVVCNDQSAKGDWRFGSTSGGLVAFDVATGEERWRVPKASTVLSSPLVWQTTVDDKPTNFVVSVSPARAVCVEPATGKVVWQINPPAKDAVPLAEGEKKYPGNKYGGPFLVTPTCGTPAIAGDILVLPANRSRPSGGNVHVEPWHVGHSAWSMTTTNATMLWRKSRQYRLKNDSPLIYRDRVYLAGPVLSLADGAKYFSKEPEDPTKVVCHGTVMNAFAGDGAIFRDGEMLRIGTDTDAKPTKVNLKLCMDMYTHMFYANGFLFTRGPVGSANANQVDLPNSGAVHCYDLRKRK